MPTLESVDGMNHPQVELQAPASRRQVKSVFTLFDGNAPSPTTSNTPSNTTPTTTPTTPRSSSPSLPKNNNNNYPTAPVPSAPFATINDSDGSIYGLAYQSSPSTRNSIISNDNEYSPQNTSATTSTLYPELTFNFTNDTYVDSYLPKDYANTIGFLFLLLELIILIGRKYDLSAMAKMAAFEHDQNQEEEDD